MRLNHPLVESQCLKVRLCSVPIAPFQVLPAEHSRPPHTQTPLLPALPKLTRPDETHSEGFQNCKNDLRMPFECTGGI